MHLISGHQCFGVIFFLHLQGQIECGINVLERLLAMSTGDDHCQYQVEGCTGNVQQQTGPFKGQKIFSLGQKWCGP